MEMTDMDRRAANALHDQFLDAGGSLHYCVSLGVTVAILSKGDGMFEVATAYCSAADTFSVDYGNWLVLERQRYGETALIKASDADAIAEAICDLCVTD